MIVTMGLGKNPLTWGFGILNIGEIPNWSGLVYELKPVYRQKVVYNNANTSNPLVYQLVLDGVKVTPTSATISIYKRGNSTALLSAQAMTKTNSMLTYSIDTTTIASWPIETGYRAEIAITYDSKVYPRLIIFDVVRWLLDLSIGVDQLADIDDRVTGMVHNGDDDLAGPIVAARSVIQARIEAKVLKDKKLVENMILDPSHVSIAMCYHILAQLNFNRGNVEKHEEYKELFADLLRDVLDSIHYDEGQDGDEDATLGGLQDTRLIM